MSSYKGSYDYSVDSKGRVNIPARLRKRAKRKGNELYTITRGYDKCLFVYPQHEWANLEKSIRRLSSTNPRDRFFLRTLLQWASDAELDSQSRISIPRELLEYAGIETAVRIVGVLDHIELWNPQFYEEYMRKQEETFEEVAQKIFDQKPMNAPGA